MLSVALRVTVVALSLALDVFAVCVGVGIGSELSRGAKLRIGAAFASAEVVMNVVGALLGAALGKVIGGVAAYLGFAALVGVGAYMIWEAVKAEESDFDLSRGWGLLLASLSISLDSLGIGFSIVYIGVPVYVTLAAVAFVSVLATASGLALGRRLGARVEERAALAGGVVLILTGLTFAALKYYNVG
jgi:putative Mn2+ efflux pump MntP